jgi:hypothetical protein
VLKANRVALPSAVELLTASAWFSEDRPAATTARLEASAPAGGFRERLSCWRYFRTSSEAEL